MSEIVTESIGKPFWNEIPSIRKNVFYSHVAANAIKSVLFVFITPGTHYIKHLPLPFQLSDPDSHLVQTTS